METNTTTKGQSMTCPSDNNRMVETTVYNSATKSATFQVHHKDCRDNKKEKETANGWWNEFVMVGKLPNGEKFPTAQMVAGLYNRENELEGDNQYTAQDFKLHNCVEHKH